jgi:hypothetical protein
MEDTRKTDKKSYDWLKPYQFKKGNPGGPGRPRGKSLKTFVREYFETLDDAGKMHFLENIDPKTAWEMAEGKPEARQTFEGKIEHSVAPETLEEVNKALEEVI